MSDTGADGKSLFQQGRYAEAIPLLQAELEGNPGDISTRVFLAASYAQSGRDAEAITEFTKLTELDPDNPQHHGNLGIAYETAGHIEQAKEQFEKALALNANYQMARQHLEALNPPAPAASVPPPKADVIRRAPSTIAPSGGDATQPPFSDEIQPPLPGQGYAPRHSGGAITPPEGLNWGAFLLPFWWSIAHQAWLWMGIIVILALVGTIGFSFIAPGVAQWSFFLPIVGAIALLITGNKVACEKRKFASPDEFKKVQKAWILWGSILLVIQIGLTVFIFVAAPAWFGNLMMNSVKQAAERKGGSFEYSRQGAPVSGKDSASSVPLYQNSKQLSKLIMPNKIGAVVTFAEYTVDASFDEVLNFYENVGKKSGEYKISWMDKTGETTDTKPDDTTDAAAKISISGGATRIVINRVPGSQETKFTIRTNSR